ncbi:hypothetical protein J6590_021150 [Homalodisca vitripennis]|nr:hypothetical protein J6590_021150 [Homalodisca vitripennis]
MARAASFDLPIVVFVIVMSDCMESTRAFPGYYPGIRKGRGGKRLCTSCTDCRPIPDSGRPIRPGGPTFGLSEIPLAGEPHEALRGGRGRRGQCIHPDDIPSCLSSAVRLEKRSSKTLQMGVRRPVRVRPNLLPIAKLTRSDFIVIIMNGKDAMSRPYLRSDPDPELPLFLRLLAFVTRRINEVKLPHCRSNNVKRWIRKAKTDGCREYGRLQGAPVANLNHSIETRSSNDLWTFLEKLDDGDGSVVSRLRAAATNDSSNENERGLHG